jgi:23S rRNA (uracil1939-C5)-methyltransferase
VIATVTVDRLAAGGDGVARHDGVAVFVPRTAPGDRVEVALTAKRRFARGRVLRLLAPGGDRVAPRCAHYDADRCGGCQLQHLSYPAQIAAKGAIVRDALTRIARRDPGPVAVTPSPVPWGYRRKLTLALRWESGGWVAGLRRFDDPDAVFALHECPITDDRVLAAWRQVLAAAPLLPRAAALRGAVRLDQHGLHLAVEGGTAWAAPDRFFTAVPAVRSLWWTPERGRRRRVAIRDGGAEGAGASFTQVNAPVAARLHAEVLAAALARQPVRAVDAYAGEGGLSADLAAAGVTVTAIERDPDAAAVAAARLAAAPGVGHRAVAAPVEVALAAALPADVVIVNPPRSGLDPAVTAVLDRAPARALIYVSCDPATLARDLGRLPRWRAVRVEAFDMFPQTAHVETLVVCEPATEAT